jgi:hypothetical protein
VFDERVLQGIESSISRETLNREDLLAGGFGGQDEARGHRASIQQYGACAALSFSATFLRARQAKSIAKDIEQRVMRLNIDDARSIVDGECDGHKPCGHGDQV